MTGDYYEIEATVKMKYKVTFDDPLTFSEAKQAFLDDNYNDVIDEEPLEIVSIDRVVQIG